MTKIPKVFRSDHLFRRSAAFQNRKFDPRAVYIIRPALKDQYEVLRADDLAQPGMIKSSIVQHLVNDQLVIADLTEQNPNVFYELAARHALRKPVLHIREDPPQSLPFDVNDVRVIHFSRSLEGAQTCIETIRDYLKDNQGHCFDSPISLGVDIPNLANFSDDQKSILTQMVDLRSNLQWLADNITQIKTVLERPDPGLQQMTDAMFVMAEVFTEIGEEDAHARRLAEAYKLYARSLRGRVDAQSGDPLR